MSDTLPGKPDGLRRTACPKRERIFLRALILVMSATLATFAWIHRDRLHRNTLDIGYKIVGAPEEAYLPAFRGAVRSADRMTVMDESTQPPRALAIADPAAVQAFAGAVELNVARMRGVIEMCACIGNRIEFYDGETLLATMHYHHGRLRWQRGKWGGDAILTGKSTAALEAWFQQQGIKPE